MRDSDDSRPHASDPDSGEDLEDDPGEDLEAMIEQADRAFASESFGTTAEEQEEGESLDKRLAEELPDRPVVDVQLAIEDFDSPDDESEMVGQASLEHDPFVAPEEAAMTVREEAPGRLITPMTTPSSATTSQTRRIDRMTEPGFDSRATPLPLGTLAPDFELRSTPDQRVSLSEFRGRPVILAFYPEDWSPVCSDQMALYQEVLPEFRKFDAELLGISVDGVWCHLAFARDRHLHFPLLADFEPKGEVARAYHVYRAKEGTSERALYVIDAEGMVRWSYLSPVGVNPGADGILRALEGLGKEGAS